MARARRNGTSPTTTLIETRNDLPEEIRLQAVELLQQHLADCIDLQTHCKQAHWNVKGPSFIALHKLFDEINEAVEGYVDDLAERLVQLGGQAEGTVRLVAGRSKLVEYPPAIMSGAEHVAALTDSLADFGSTARSAINEFDELGEKDAADLMTGISRGIDQWLWFVEAHQQADA